MIWKDFNARERHLVWRFRALYEDIPFFPPASILVNCYSRTGMSDNVAWSLKILVSNIPSKRGAQRSISVCSHQNHRVHRRLYRLCIYAVYVRGCNCDMDRCASVKVVYVEV